MKKGINFWSYPSETDIIAAMSMAKKAGFEGIEFCLTKEGPLSLQSTEKDILRLAAAANENDIEFSGLASWLPWEYPITAGDAAVRAKAKEIVKKQIEIAQLLGIDTVLVVPGYVGVDFVEGSEVCPYDTAYERSFEAISELSVFAEDAKVSIGVENVWNKFLLSPLEMRDFIDKIDSPYVGSYLDVGNVLLTGYPEHWVKILGKRIKKVHFKDYRRNPGGFNAFVDLLAGDVDFPTVVDALEEVGYEGYCNAEMMPPYRDYPDQILYNTSASMDRILKKL
jgi:hexulose-6-phosphate isomerase